MFDWEFKSEHSKKEKTQKSLIELIKTQCKSCGRKYYILRPACPFCGTPTSVNFTKEDMEQRYKKAFPFLGRVNRHYLMEAVNKGNVIDYLIVVKNVDLVAYHNIVQNIKKGVDVQMFLRGGVDVKRKKKKRTEKKN